jgi:hypothetical protein
LFLLGHTYCFLVYIRLKGKKGSLEQLG